MNQFNIFHFHFANVDIDECAKPNRCGKGALCVNRAGTYTCECPEGSIPDPDPSIRCITVVTCTSNNDCPGNAICDEHQRCLCPTPNVGNDCRHPCESISCGPNTNCMIVNQEAKCLCSPGFVGSADRIGGCVDDDECKHLPPVCPGDSLCVNTPGSFTCQVRIVTEHFNGFESGPKLKSNVFFHFYSVSIWHIWRSIPWRLCTI